MSNIAEQKALEAYPIDIIPDDDTMGFTSSDRNEVIRLGYIKGYDQAMQDMLEKACGYLAGIALTHPFLLDLDCFTKYMQDE